MCGLLDKETQGGSRGVMYSQSLIHTHSKPRNVISLMAICQLTDLNSRGKNPKDVIFFFLKRGEKNGKKRRREKEMPFSHGHKKTHNTGGVKFQQASGARGHIPARDACVVKGVRGQHARGGVKKRSKGEGEEEDM